MPEIEFIETEHPTAPNPALAPARPDWRLALRLLPALLAFAATALTLWSPFMPVYSTSQPADSIYQSGDGSDASAVGVVLFHFDGWGRSLTNQGGSTGSEHGVRYGIVLAVCAGIFLVAGLLFATAGLMRASTTRTRATVGARLAAVLGVGGTAALSATVYLDYLSSRDQDAIFGTVDGPGFSIRTLAGACWWLAGLGALAGLLAAAASLLIGRLDAAVPDQPEAGISTA